jgi:hypothetical protein
MLALGTSLRESGRVTDAVDTLSQYVEKNPNEPTGMYELAWSLHVNPGEENLRLARAYYERALDHNPSDELRAIIIRKLEDLARSTTSSTK